MNESKTPTDTLTMNQAINQKMVRRVDTNVGQDIIIVTADKVRLCLQETLQRLQDRRAWIAPAGILATLAVGFPATTFQDGLGIPKDSWKALFAAAAVATIVWLITCLSKMPKALKIEGIVNRLRADSLASEQAQSREEIEQRQTSNGLWIGRASYGAGDKRVDLAATLNRLVVDGKLHVRVGNELAGVDPCYGTPKSLLVTYQINGQVFEKSALEGADLDLP